MFYYPPVRARLSQKVVFTFVVALSDVVPLFVRCIAHFLKWFKSMSSAVLPKLFQLAVSHSLAKGQFL